MAKHTEYQGEYYPRDPKSYLILTEKETLRKIARALPSHWLLALESQLQALAGREITIESYLEETDHLARIMRALWASLFGICPEWFEGYIKALDPDLEGRAYSFRDTTVSLQADLIEIKKFRGG